MAERGDLPVTWSLVAAEDLSDYQYRAIVLDASGKAEPGDIPSSGTYLGALQNKPKNAEHATVALLGVTKAQAGGAVTLGDPITYTSSGFYAVGQKAIPTLAQSGMAVFSNIGCGTIIVGHALSTVASGGIFSLYSRGPFTIISSNEV